MGSDIMANAGSENRAETTQRMIQSFAFIIAVFASVLLCCRFALPGFSEHARSYEIRLDGRVNPNDAPFGSLVRLPGVGISRASAIIQYREHFSGKGEQARPFEKYRDLQKVKGIGPKTAQKIGQWLKFD